jgi:hypothetical protein
MHPHARTGQHGVVYAEDSVSHSTGREVHGVLDPSSGEALSELAVSKEKIELLDEVVHIILT